MDFAKKQLEKYGWSEGQGLGRNQDGISKPLKPKLKFDNAGLGHSISDEFDNPWWQRVYDEAAGNLVTKEKNDSIVLETVDGSVDISIRKRKKRDKSEKSNKCEKYKGFIKTSELDGCIERKLYGDLEMSNNPEVQDQEKGNFEIPCVTNEELFRICGGRTAHKGARHGLKMNAKLARIAEQEKNLIHHMSVPDSDTSKYCYVQLPKKRKKNK